MRRGPSTTQGRRALRAALLLLGGAAVLCVCLIAGLLTDRPPKRTFSDGSTITLEAVTFGDQEVVRGAWWRKIARSVLPLELKSLAGCRVFSGPGRKSLVFYVRPSGLPMNLDAEVRDEHGCVNQNDLMGSGDAGTGTGAILFESFPRRGELLNLNIDSPFAGQDRAAFTVPNPDPGPHPSWTAGALPMTRRDGDVAVTLTRFEARPPLPQSSPPSREGWIHATYRITKGGAAAPAWRALPFTVTTPSGDRWDTFKHLASPEPALEHYLDFDSNKWQDEPVWKVRMEVAPGESPWPGVARPWSAADVWIVPGLAIPSEGRTTRVGREGKVRGVNLALVEMAGPRPRLRKDVALGESTSGGFPPQVVLLAHWPPDGREREFFVFARDERGTLHRAHGNRRWYSSIATESLALYLLPGTRKIDLLVVVHSHRFVEFLVPNPFLKDRPTPPVIAVPAVR